MPQPLSAADALSPAWRYTRQYLSAQPRTLTAIKICAVALFAEMGGLNFNFGGSRNFTDNPSFHAVAVATALVFGLVAFVVGLVLFYVGSRLQFVIFELVLRHETMVAPIWRRYGAATWRWVGLKLLCFLAFIIAFVVAASPFVAYFVLHAKNGSQNTPVFFTVIAAAVVVGIALLFTCIGTYIALNCFSVPVMAFESTTLRETLRRVRTLFRAQSGAVLLFVFLRCIVAIGCILAAEIVLAIGALITFLPFGLVGYVAWHMLYGGALPAEIALGGILAVLGLTFLTAFVVAAIRLVGHVHVFLQAYTLFFLAGRYAPVDPYLAPFMPAQFTQPQGWTPAPYPPSAF